MPKMWALLMVSITSAQWISILDGMQPRFRQVPPKGPSSMMATDSPRPAASEETSRPEPEPITIRSKCCISSSPNGGNPPNPPLRKGGEARIHPVPPGQLFIIAAPHCSTALQHRYAPLGLGQAWRNTYRGGKRERLFSSLVMNSINAGCPVSITCLARLMAGIISAGSTTLSPWAPNDWARVA